MRCGVLLNPEARMAASAKPECSTHRSLQGSCACPGRHRPCPLAPRCRIPLRGSMPCWARFPAQLLQVLPCHIQNQLSLTLTCHCRSQNDPAGAAHLLVRPQHGLSPYSTGSHLACQLDMLLLMTSVSCRMRADLTALLELSCDLNPLRRLPDTSPVLRFSPLLQAARCWGQLTSRALQAVAVA